MDNRPETVFVFTNKPSVNPAEQMILQYKSFAKIKSEIIKQALRMSKNQRKASQLLGIPSSTFHDWQKKKENKSMENLTDSLREYAQKDVGDAKARGSVCIVDTLSGNIEITHIDGKYSFTKLGSGEVIREGFDFIEAVDFMATLYQVATADGAS